MLSPRLRALRAPALALSLALLLPAASRAAVPTAIALPFGIGCDFGRSATARHLAVDDDDIFWVAAQCGGRVLVTSSRDGGATWALPTELASSGAEAQVTIAAGRPGHTLVAWQSPGQLLARSTNDSGATWSPVVALAPIPPNPAIRNASLSIVADATHYHVMVAEDLSNSVAVRTSLDLGATWQPLVTLSTPFAYGDLVHDAATDALELVSDDPNLWRRTSLDHGATFGMLAMQPSACCVVGSDWALGGGGLLHGVGYQSTEKRANLGASTAADITGLTTNIRLQRAVAADAAGNSFVVSREEGGLRRVVLQRVPASGPVAEAPLALDVDGAEPNVAACDIDAAAVVWRALDGTSYFNKTCFAGGTCCVPVTNLAPSCNAGGPYATECAGAATMLALSASGSSDPEGAALTASWTTSCPGGAFDDASSLSPKLFVDGTVGCDVACDVTVTVSDGLLSSSCTTSVSVADRTGPVVLAASEPDVTLWPPNHRMVSVALADLATRITDACDATSGLRLVGCVSDQPDDATGDGHAEADCVVSSDGAAALVRAERDGARPEGRTYSLLAVATDACGNASSVSVAGTVRVPRDQR